MADLARLLDAFAVAVADARADLGFVNLGGWTSEAAAPVSEQLARVQKLLIAADNAFTTGAMAVGSYAREHAKAREDAASALMIWQAAEHASAISRGAVVGGTMPAGVTGDMAEADLARAALKLSTAQQAWESAGRWLAGVLRDAEVGAPKDPGPVAVLVNAVQAAVRPVTNVIEVAGEGTRSAVVGVGEGVYGMGKGAVELGLLALNLVPTRAIYEPREYLETWEDLWKGVAWAASNPGKFAALAIDLKTLQSDPARWAGKLVPELLLIFLTAGAAGAAKGAEAADQVRRAADTIEDAIQNGRDVAPPVGEAIIAHELTLLNLRATQPAGQAVSAQLASHAKPDDWFDQPLREGDRIILVDRSAGTGFAAPATSEITSNAGRFFGGLQIPGMRTIGPDEISLPLLPPSLRIYEVMGGDLDAARSLARANPEFGKGGDLQIFLPDIDEAIMGSPDMNVVPVMCGMGA